MKQTGREAGFKKVNSRLFAVMLVAMGIASPVGGMLAEIRWDVLYLASATLSAACFAVILLLRDIAAGAAAYVVERVLRKNGLLSVCSTGCMAAVLGLGLAEGSTFAVLLAFFSMNGLISLLEPMLESYLNELLPSAQRATLLSFFSMMVSVAMVVTFFGVSWLADHTGIRAAIITLAALWVPVQLWLTIRAVRLDRDHSRMEGDGHESARSDANNS